jgi:hypothetical protein
LLNLQKIKKNGEEFILSKLEDATSLQILALNNDGNTALTNRGKFNHWYLKNLQNLIHYGGSRIMGNWDMLQPTICLPSFDSKDYFGSATSKCLNFQNIREQVCFGKNYTTKPKLKILRKMMLTFFNLNQVNGTLFF